MTGDVTVIAIQVTLLCTQNNNNILDVINSLLASCRGMVMSKISVDLIRLAGTKAIDWHVVIHILFVYTGKYGIGSQWHTISCVFTDNL